MDCATYMCEGILIEILSRLPAKSLVRFMAVCRLWKSIITSPQFLLSKRPTKLLVHTDQELHTLVEDGDENRLMFETDLPLEHYSFYSAVVKGSDNGLICIVITKPPSGRKYCVIIWNPFIRKHVVSPDNDKYISVSEIASGFGGTISRGDYKFVRVVYLLVGQDSWEKVVDIYSLKSGTWRTKKFTPVMGGIRNSVALLRGRLHWIGGHFRKEILPFELEDEVFENKIMVPESIQSRQIGVHVTVLRESLAVIASEIKNSHSTVWVMEEYGDVNSWIKLCNIGLEEHYYSDINMVHLKKDGELLLGFVKWLFPTHRKLVTYHPKTMKTCDFGGGSLSSKPGPFGFTNNYKESLVLLGDHRAVDNHHGVSCAWTGFHWLQIIKKKFCCSLDLFCCSGK